MRRKTLRQTIIQGLARTAKAGLSAAAQDAPPRRGKRVKKGASNDECTPCQAYGAVGDAYDRVRSGSL